MFEYSRKIFGYECDIYGHLNNSVYQNIYEEARAMALDEMQLPLKDLNDLGIQIFLKRIEIDFIKGIPLGTEIIIRSRIIEFSRVKSIWKQEIYHQKGTLMSKAIVTGVFIKEGKPYRIDKDLEDRFLIYITIQENSV